jgi:hypothetical protein
MVENQHRHSFSISVVFNAQPRSGGAGRSSKIHSIKGAERQMLAVIRSIWPVETRTGTDGIPARLEARKGGCGEEGVGDPLLPRLRVVEEKDRRKNDTIPDAGWEATS